MNFIKKCLLTVMAVGFAMPMLPYTWFTKAYFFKNENGKKCFVFLKKKKLPMTKAKVYRPEFHAKVVLNNFFNKNEQVECNIVENKKNLKKDGFALVKRFRVINDTYLEPLWKKWARWGTALAVTAGVGAYLYSRFKTS